MTNVINLPCQPKPEMEISEYDLQVGGELYRVRRAIEPDTRGGFVTIKDDAGKPVLVFSARFPDEHIGTLVVAWRTGRDRGRHEGNAGGSENAT